MHGFANPKRFLSIARPLTPWLLALGLMIVGLALAWGLIGVPASAADEETQRCQASRRGDGDVITAEVDTVRAGGKCEVDAVVDDDAHRGPGKAIHEDAGERDNLTVRQRLRPDLDRVDALADHGLQHGDCFVVVRPEVGDAMNAR